VDRDGTVWYSDFGELFISKFDPKTLKLTEYPGQAVSSRAAGGESVLEFDRHGALWFDTMFQGSLGTLDPRTGEIEIYPLAPELQRQSRAAELVGLAP